MPAGRFNTVMKSCRRASSTRLEPPSTLPAQIEAEESSELRTDLAGIHSMGILSIGCEKTRVSLIACQDKSQNSVLKSSKPLLQGLTPCA